MKGTFKKLIGWTFFCVSMEDNFVVKARCGSGSEKDSQRWKKGKKAYLKW